MIQFIAAYRHKLAFGCLLFYLSCAFQPSILESLHFMTHLGEMIQDEYTAHDLHHETDHDHAILELLEITFSSATDHSSHESEHHVYNLKKLPETSQYASTLTAINSYNSSSPFYVPLIYRTPERTNPSPPPRS